MYTPKKVNLSEEEIAEYLDHKGFKHSKKALSIL